MLYSVDEINEKNKIKIHINASHRECNVYCRYIVICKLIAVL